MRRAGFRGAAVVNKAKARRPSILPTPGELVRPPSEQAIQKEVSEGFSGDDVVTILRVVNVSDAKIERVIELMDFIEKIRRGEA